jgi:hypothetical protein
MLAMVCAGGGEDVLPVDKSSPPPHGPARAAQAAGTSAIRIETRDHLLKA